MKEELISLDTARLAKEVGFNVTLRFSSVNHAYFPPIKEFKEFNYENLEDYSQFNLKQYNPKDELIEKCGIPYYLAPTQSLLQKWLREKHKIHIDVVYFINQPINNELWADCYQFFVNGEAFHPYCKTYEEALELGLLKTLKLIKV